MDARKAATDTALIAVFAALICAFSIVPAIPLGIGPVPITLQTLAVALTALVLGPWRGFLATTLYLLVGIAGLPVFAGGTSGIVVFSKASAGYLISFPIAAIIIGYAARLLVRRWSETQTRLPLLFVAAIAGSILIIHPLGILGMYRYLHAAKGLSLGKVAMMDLAFWPGDLLKSFLAAGVASAVHKAFPAVLVTYRPFVTRDTL